MRAAVKSRKLDLVIVTFRQFFPGPATHLATVKQDDVAQDPPTTCSTVESSTSVVDLHAYPLPEVTTCSDQQVTPLPKALKVLPLPFPIPVNLVVVDFDALLVVDFEDFDALLVFVPSLDFDGLLVFVPSLDFDGLLVFVGDFVFVAPSLPVNSIAMT